jgi:hypothetical protein
MGSHVNFTYLIVNLQKKKKKGVKEWHHKSLLFNLYASTHIHIYIDMSTQ